MNQRRLRLELMNWQLQLNHQHNVNNMLMVRVAEEHRRVQQRRRRRRTWWVKPWIGRRLEFGQYIRLLEELRLEDVPAFRNFLRMEPELFVEILNRVRDSIWRQDTFYRRALDPGRKLALTLRYLASGDSYHSLMYSFRVPVCTMSGFVPVVCEAIVAAYKDEVIASPTTPAEWRPIAEEFSRRWNFHDTLGALDGKHIAIKCPKHAGSNYYNYKQFHSIILMALVDAQYKFLWVDVGAMGSAGDANVFNHSELRACINDETIGFPQPDPLPGDDADMPYFLVGDDAFALRTWMMKPYSKRHLTDPERIFNYRLSRARRIVENGFGILSHRFQCLLTTLQQVPSTVESIVLTCVCLHNLIRIRHPIERPQYADQEHDDQQMVDGAWRDDVRQLLPIRGPRRGRETEEAKIQRDYLKAYYWSPSGGVPWQMDMI